MRPWLVGANGSFIRRTLALRPGAMLTQELEKSKAQRPIARRLRLNFPALVTIASALAALAAMFAADGQEITREPKTLELWAAAIAATLGVLSCAVVMSVRPRTPQTLAMATGGSIMAALLCWMPSWVVLTEIRQHLIFGGIRDTRERDIPIIVAEISKGGYNVWLESYSALVKIEENDYVAAFGRAKRLRPVGYCVRATVQTAGAASRIIAHHGISLPAGSVERCPYTLEK